MPVDRDAEKFVLPANAAVSKCVPARNEDVVSQAWPFWICAEPINVPLSRKSTVPIGAIAEVTVARSMIGVPVEAEVKDVRSAVADAFTPHTPRFPLMP